MLTVAAVIFPLALHMLTILRQTAFEFGRCNTRCRVSCDTVHGIADDAWNETLQASVIAQVLSGERSLQAACELYGLSIETVRSWVPLYRHRTLQALDEKLQQASLLTSVNAVRMGNAAYTGSLDDISVPDLLQTCQMGGKDGVITVTRGTEQSTIWCERGAIVDAESGRLRGEAAVYRIVNIPSGQVSAEFRLEPRTPTVELPCHVLLLEAARHKDECGRLIEQLDGLRSIFMPAPGSWAADTTLAERDVMRLCDGERAVSDVLAESEISDLETLTIMTGLAGRGYLMLDGTSAPLPPVAANSDPLDWDTRTSVYLTLPRATAPAGRSSTAHTPLLVAVGLALAMLVWLSVATLYGRVPFLAQ